MPQVYGNMYIGLLVINFRPPALRFQILAPPLAITVLKACRERERERERERVNRLQKPNNASEW